jgi:hypothetical protein
MDPAISTKPNSPKANSMPTSQKATAPTKQGSLKNKQNKSAENRA